MRNSILSYIVPEQGVIRSRKSKDRQCNDQKEKGKKEKQWSTKHYAEN
jgi:hypothetical protein